MAQEKKEQSKQEIAKKLAKVFGELQKTSQLEQMIRDNKITFKVGEVNYRVRKPTPAEQMDIENFRRKKYLEYVNDDTYLFRKQWIEKYKKKGVDILKMETEILTLESEIEKLELRLAPQPDGSINIEKLEKEIYELKNKQQLINIEKTDLLSSSIEDQLEIAVNSYYTYAVLEKAEKEEWVKVFDNYETFMNCKDERILEEAFYFINFIIYRNSLGLK